jgi:prefoldin subunit 4
MHVPLSDAQELLLEQTSEIDGEVSMLKEELGGIKEQLSGLKAYLYARFGRGINLEA